MKPHSDKWLEFWLLYSKALIWFTLTFPWTAVYLTKTLHLYLSMKCINQLYDSLSYALLHLSRAGEIMWVVLILNQASVLTFDILKFPADYNER